MAEATLTSLDKLDPIDAWKPWQPDARQRFDLKWAGHLYRRATFGAGLHELQTAVSRGLPATLNHLFEGEADAAERLDFLIQTGMSIAKQNNPTALRGWWIYCMLHGRHPLREKLTLFWHNHFATSITKVQKTALMFGQNLTLRKYALGKFPEFLLAMSKDPAMLLWLDANDNVKGKPNENYAREVMELFSLGVHSGYTEHDIREAARAFTGWRVDDEGHFTYRSDLHDEGVKTVLGQKGNWGGDDVVRICLAQPPAARFLVRKLYTNLISESAVPPDSFLEPLASDFRKSGYDINALLRRILSSRHFFSDHAYRQRIKSPVEYVVGAVWAVTDRGVAPGVLTTQMEKMGQALFSPPNVKGWPGSTAWLNSSTVLARHNFAHDIAAGGLRDTAPVRTSALSARERERLLAEEAARQAEEARRAALEAQLRAQGKPVPPRPVAKVPPPPPPPANMDVAALVRHQKATTPAAIVNVLTDLLLQGPVPADSRTRLVAFLEKGNPKGDALDRRIRDAAHLVMTLPEYQLC
jgi:uncharacterized protein (DUF1800 family)